MVVDTPKEVLIERRPYEDLLPFPRTTSRHIGAQLLPEQTAKEEEKVKEPEEVNNEEPTNEAMEEEKEVTKEEILAMYAHCNVVELDSEASQFVEGMVKAKNVGKPILPCTFGGSSYCGLCDMERLLMLFLIYFSLVFRVNSNKQNRKT
jgi:hypothetical protein